MKNEIRKIGKECNEVVGTKTYKIRFTDSARFRASSWSNLIDNLTEGIDKIKCRNCSCFLEYENVKDNLMNYKCLSCNKDYSNKLDEELKKKFKNKFTCSNNDINKFILLLRKGVYPYQYIDDFEKLIETTLAKKEEFYSRIYNLYIEEITDADYMHGKWVCKDF